MWASFSSHFLGKAPKKERERFFIPFSKSFQRALCLVHTYPFFPPGRAPVFSGDPMTFWHPHHDAVKTSPLTTWSWSLTSLQSHSKCWRSPPSAWPARPSSPWRCRKQWKTQSDLLSESQCTEEHIIKHVFLPLYSSPFPMYGDTHSHLLPTLRTRHVPLKRLSP